MGKKGVPVTRREILLGVNIDHIATLRQVRGTNYPDLLAAARLAESSGADGITVHLREDRRHIQDADVYSLMKGISTRLNLEMAVTQEMVEIAQQVRPAYCCFVPEKRKELTTEGGLNVREQLGSITKAVKSLESHGVACSLFIDPDIEQISCAEKAGTQIVEIHTGAYAEAENESEKQQELDRIRAAVDYAFRAGIQVNAGHGLHLGNVREIACIKEITELNIGHALVCDAVFVGIESAVSTMKQLMKEARES